METHYIHEDVPVDVEAKRQRTNAARLPIVFKHIASTKTTHRRERP